MDSNDKIRSISRLWLISLWSWLIEVETIRLPALILLNIHCIFKSNLVLMGHPENIDASANPGVK